MSRRKNAGAGYGYMFSGAFAKKADAVKKEKKRKGSFVKAVFVNGGMRYAVMTPRTNPRKTTARNNFSVRKTRAGWVLKVNGDYSGTFDDKMAAQRVGRELTGRELHGEVIKRRLAELNTPPKNNPSELLVMGANPHDITVPPGSTITIRMNPTATRENLYFGFGPSEPSKKELAASRREFKGRVRARTKEGRGEYKRLRRSARSSFKDKGKLEQLFHEVYGSNPAICGAMIGGEPCTRKPGHRGPHLPQGATMRTRTRLRRGWQPARNPSAAALRETFTGTPYDRITVHHEPHMPAGDYAKLGELLSLYVKPRHGGQVQEIRAKDRPTVVADESARQIWFMGGDQNIESALAIFSPVERAPGVFELGEARRIDYQQRKEHVAHPEQDKWRHNFGEESGVLPIVLYDVRKKRLLLEGGEYEIRAEGIIN